MLQKGRANRPMGEGHFASKLTGEDVLLIRQLYSHGMGQPEIARRMGITRGYVSNITRGAAWKHLLPPEKRKDAPTR
jgi:hypothetical protein